VSSIYFSSSSLPDLVGPVAVDADGTSCAREWSGARAARGEVLSLLEENAICDNEKGGVAKEARIQGREKSYSQEIKEIKMTKGTVMCDVMCDVR
jgi:hypothetical protein